MHAKQNDHGMRGVVVDAANETTRRSLIDEIHTGLRQFFYGKATWRVQSVKAITRALAQAVA